MASDQMARWFAEHPTAQRNGRILEAPLKFVLPRVAFGLVAAFGMLVAGRAITWTKPNSLDPEFLKEVDRIGNVAQRLNGSPVFVNPFRNRIPGNIVGPEDVKNA